MQILAVAVYVVQVTHHGRGMAPRPDLPLLSLVAVALLAVSAPLSILLPRVLARAALRQVVADSGPAPSGGGSRRTPPRWPAGCWPCGKRRSSSAWRSWRGRHSWVVSRT